MLAPPYIPLPRALFTGTTPAFSSPIQILQSAAGCLAFPGLFSYLSYTDQAYLPRDGTAHRGLDPPTLISSQGKAPLICPQATLTKAIPQFRFPLPKQEKFACLGLYHC